MKKRADNLDTAAILSAITGVLYGIGAYFVLRLVGEQNPNALYIALCAGLAFALLLFPYLVFYKKRKAKKYGRFEKTISSPVLCRVEANFSTASGNVCNGRMYLCENEIVFASLEKRTPLVDRVAWNEIKSIQSYRQVNVTVTVKDGRAYCLQTPDTEAIMAVLSQMSDADFVKR